MCKASIAATVEKLDVKPGECLIVRFKSPGGVDCIDMFDEVLKGALPEHVKWFYIVGDDVDFAVVKREEVEGS